ncbi:tRNA (5-methylaminomethyl-2-thiouridine)(34)-methyltransferase MnmD [Jejuia pallidilutea]|uniref:Putative peptidase n=1 Tax=Jejuia pallidilutea TaxID=504487 RepID=A0A090W9W3_9FLAO|nr:tRNA (5-methylaminomethyl-2-thiouridine)(34)-methyltransferase MnmD [Jejuia pallidilutea]GAL67828.1 putative peptidase [Jejuia pallidilutea]GAL72963.1 putative peptidase [Jejuia pallidilutea]GAL89971.1 putative peptidase [Jejuia pallidilutea]
MKREIITTADGSSTIHLPDWNEQYHSKHGAIQEAYHVFIKHGLHYFYDQKLALKPKNTISILEVGFGTGLNAFVTYLEAEKLKLKINYVGVEAYPVTLAEIQLLNYPFALNAEDKADVFLKLHTTSWNTSHSINETFSITKQQKAFDDINAKNSFNIIYFDAFGARVQPELWTETIFKKMFNALAQNGILVTYSAKGSVRRAMQAVGFTVKKLPGPPGKREMLQAIKL